jgi:hypothetical protein
MVSEVDKICGISYSFIIEFSNKMKLQDTHWVLDEWKNLYKENIELRKKVKVLELKVSALEST